MEASRSVDTVVSESDDRENDMLGELAHTGLYIVDEGVCSCLDLVMRYPSCDAGPQGGKCLCFVVGVQGNAGMVLTLACWEDLYGAE